MRSTSGSASFFPLSGSGHDCHASGWTSFRVPLSTSELHAADDTFEWTIGPLPDCVADWVWEGFSIKGLAVQAVAGARP
jgi:hypothetical protein